MYFMYGVLASVDKDEFCSVMPVNWFSKDCDTASYGWRDKINWYRSMSQYDTLETYHWCSFVCLLYW